MASDATDATVVVSDETVAATAAVPAAAPAVVPDDFFELGAGVRAGATESLPQPSSPSPAQSAVLAFDVETTGLAHGDVAVQIAYSRRDQEHMNYIRLPRGVRISHSAASVHGISESKLHKDGVDADVALSRFFAACASVVGSGGLLVAHNVSFDRRLVRQTALKHGVPLPEWWHNDSHFFCTMAASAPFSKMVTRGGRRKNFKNIELYRYFQHFQSHTPDDPIVPRTLSLVGLQLHDALVDVRITLYSYDEGKRRGMW